MRASTAYFVGAGTIVAAIAIGLGGGIVAGNIMNPVSPKQGPDTSKIAQRADAKPATTEAPSERLQYLTGSQAFGAMVAAPAQAEAKSDAKAESKPEAKSEAVKPDTQTTQANAEQPAQQPSQAAAVEPRNRHRRRLRKSQSLPSGKHRQSRHPHPTTPMPRPGILTSSAPRLNGAGRSAVSAGPSAATTISAIRVGCATAPIGTTSRATSAKMPMRARSRAGRAAAFRRSGYSATTISVHPRRRARARPMTGASTSMA